MRSRTESYIVTYEMSTPFRIGFIRWKMETELGCKIRLRGRHKNRRAILGPLWRKHSQNDISWQIAEKVSFYKRTDV